MKVIFDLDGTLTNVSSLNKFRPGASQFINHLIKSGHTVEVHTSRDKTTSKSLIGQIAKTITILQFVMNTVKVSKINFNFYTSDYEKIKGIVASKPTVVFEDKMEIIKELAKQNIKVICIKENYKNCNETMEKLIGKKKLEMYNFLAKTNKCFNRFEKLIRFTVTWFYKPIYLDCHNLIYNDVNGITYAPNHVKTIDPIIINAYIGTNIHWIGLKRFFIGNDSIFHNNKSKILCSFTKKGFEAFGNFPIERESDVEKPNNLESMKKMRNTLKCGYNLGIFPVGTTRKIEGQIFGEFHNGICEFSKMNKSYIQPISIYWHSRRGTLIPIVRFGKAFIATDDINQSMQKYKEIQNELYHKTLHYIEGNYKDS